MDQDIYADLENLLAEGSAMMSDEFTYQLEKEGKETYLIVTPFEENEDGVLEESETEIKFKLVEM